MPIEGFDYKAFAKNLSDQVAPALPPDLADADKQYIVNIVFNFCFMAGEALANDTSITLNADQACIITQFIGEWAFHKSIDIIKSGIGPQFRDAILQKIAFTVFEIAKTATIKNLPQGDMIAVVEHHVKKAYGEALQELKNRGALSEEQVNNALSHSNIDDMAKAQAQAEAEAQAEMQAVEQADSGVSVPVPVQSNDKKLLKLATFAMVLKYLPSEKQQGLLERFSPEDAQILYDYSSMDDLENKLDKGFVVKCLKEIKKTLPEPKRLNPDKINARIYKIVKNSNNSKISNIMIKERLFVRNYVNSAGSSTEESTVPPRVAEIVCNYLEEKLTAK